MSLVMKMKRYKINFELLDGYNENEDDIQRQEKEERLAEETKKGNLQNPDKDKESFVQIGIEIALKEKTSKNIFLNINSNIDILRIIFEIIKCINRGMIQELNDDEEININNKEVIICKGLDIFKHEFSRVYIKADNNKMFSFCFPFNIKQKDGRMKVYLNKIEISTLVQEYCSIFLYLHNITSDIEKNFYKQLDEMREYYFEDFEDINVYTQKIMELEFQKETATEDKIKEIQSLIVNYENEILEIESEKRDIEEYLLKMTEVISVLVSIDLCYIRFDYDKKNDKGEMHPLNHFDIYCNDLAGLKLGLESKISFDEFIEIVRNDNECSYIKSR